MPTGIQEGQGFTLGFGSSSVTLNLLDVNMDGISRTDVLTTDQSTTGLETYIASTVAEGGTFTFNVNWNFTDQAALYTLATSTAAETITITPPKTLTTAGTIAFSGYVNNLNMNGQKGTLCNGTMVIKVADDITFTDEA
jgi:hypothetical protein